MNLGPTAPKRNDILWELLLFHNCSFSTERMDYQVDPLSVVSMEYISKKRHALHLSFMNINSILPKIDEIRYIAKLTNATVIGLSETKLDNTVLRSELEIEGYDLVRSNRSRRGGGLACFVKSSISYNRKPNFCVNAESIFIEISLPKSKPVLIGILHRPSIKYDFVNCLERTFSDINIFESQECYLFDDININLQPKD